MEAIERLQAQAEEAERLKGLGRGSDEFSKWHRDTEVLIEHIFGSDSRHKEDFTEVRYHPMAWSTATRASAFDQRFRDGLGTAQQVLASMVAEIEEYWIESESSEVASAVLPLARLETLCDRFHLVCRRLRARYNSRSTLDVDDEYDVQDLMHALLVVDFEDVRREDWVPTYAGSGSRIDFVLREHGIVIEVKKTRRGLTDRAVGEQLIVDRARYEKHPDCKFLLCFVYDPEGLIGNPRGLENDLSSNSGGVPTRVIVAPRA